MGKVNRGQGNASCEVCGKNQDRCFEVHLGGEKHVFDSFECAMRGLMPTCSQCGCLILGAGVLAEGRLYCSHSCASLLPVREYEAHSPHRGPANL
ncbi:MAG: hypothetical protein ACM3PS_07940 [Syntrophothermus sp.]|jgi:hypothetical protein